MLYKSFLTFLALFATLSLSEEDGEFYSDDSSAENDGGVGLSLLQEDGEPLVLFYRGNDRNKRVYCFKFTGSYEADNYVSPGENDEIDGSKVDFGEDVDWRYEGDQGEGGFAFRISSAGEDKWDEFNLTFTEVEMADEYGYTALHFDIAIRGYLWDDEATEDSVFALSVDLDECSADHSQERASQRYLLFNLYLFFKSILNTCIFE